MSKKKKKAKVLVEPDPPAPEAAPSHEHKVLRMPLPADADPCKDCERVTEAVTEAEDKERARIVTILDSVRTRLGAVGKRAVDWIKMRISGVEPPEDPPGLGHG